MTLPPVFDIVGVATAYVLMAAGEIMVVMTCTFCLVIAGAWMYSTALSYVGRTVIS